MPEVNTIKHEQEISMKQNAVNVACKYKKICLKSLSLKKGKAF